MDATSITLILTSTVTWFIGALCGLGWNRGPKIPRGYESCACCYGSGNSQGTEGYCQNCDGNGWIPKEAVSRIIQTKPRVTSDIAGSKGWMRTFRPVTCAEDLAKLGSDLEKEAGGEVSHCYDDAFIEHMAGVRLRIAMAAYHRYGEVTEFTNFMGQPMPSWEELPPKIQQAWIAAANG